MLREAHDSGRVVLVKELLANGRLTARGDAGMAGELAALAQSLATTPDAIALAAALAQPWADVVLLGASTVAQLESNLGALELQLAPADLRRLDRMRVPAQTYWQQRSRLPWN